MYDIFLIAVLQNILSNMCDIWIFFFFFWTSYLFQCVRYESWNWLCTILSWLTFEFYKNSFLREKMRVKQVFRSSKSYIKRHWNWKFYMRNRDITKNMALLCTLLHGRWVWQKILLELAKKLCTVFWNYIFSEEITISLRCTLVVLFYRLSWYK
jgi:hypothetical protein